MISTEAVSVEIPLGNSPNRATLQQRDSNAIRSRRNRRKQDNKGIQLGTLTMDVNRMQKFVGSGLRVLARRGNWEVSLPRKAEGIRQSGEDGIAAVGAVVFT
jgi:hypothetical protein